MRPAARWRGGLVLLVLAAGLPCVATAEEGLQPYQIVRSLQLVQDRIAGGDHAAVPMQAKLLQMADARFRAAGEAEFKDPKNFRALLAYGMSGGNPATVAAAVSRAGMGDADKALATGVLAYLNGKPAAAVEALAGVDPMAMPDDIGAFLALVKGSLLAADKPEEALRQLDEARLLSPGTLVEEAALRRSIGLAALQGDAARFALASTQYASRFLHSPYAAQFADTFVSGAIALDGIISQDKLAEITALMDAERERVIYLRIARRAAIDGRTVLSAFASAKAEQARSGRGNEDDPRALLYSTLSTVTSSGMEEMRAKLGKIDRSRLSENDRNLLDAARAVADELVAPPEAAPAAAKEAVAPPPAAAQDAAPAGTEDLPPVEGAVSERPAAEAQASRRDETAPEEKAPAVPEQAAATPLPQPAAVDPASSDPTDAAMREARRKLDLVDQMLGDAPK